MRSITIIGAGQGGLLLAIGLLQNGYKVTLINDKNEDELKNGRILSSQVLFSSALSFEKKLGLNFWDEKCPQHHCVSVNINLPRDRISWQGKTKRPFQSVDQRLKFYTWIKLFKQLGGNFIVTNITPHNINSYVAHSDLAILSVGKAELATLFDKDYNKSTFSNPRRHLALLYAKTNLSSNARLGVSINIVPSVGEFCSTLGLSVDGTLKEMMLFEAIPENDFDCWNNQDTPKTYAKKAQNLINNFLNHEVEHYSEVYVPSSNEVLSGRYTPIVRKPIGQLSPNQLIMGMADTVVLNDPITGQGANNATKAAKIYLAAIIAHHNQPFNEKWMANTFAKYWDEVKFSTWLTNKLLEPPDDALKNLLFTASNNKPLANFIADSFDDPRQLFPWIESEEGTCELISSLINEPILAEQ